MATDSAHPRDMRLFVDGRRAHKEDVRLGSGQQLVCFADLAHPRPAASLLALEGFQHLPHGEQPGNRYENRPGCDCITLTLPAPFDEVQQGQVEMVLAPNKLLVLYNTAADVDGTLAELEANPGTFSPARVLHLFLSLLTRPDAARMEALEERIADLEEDILHGKITRDPIETISQLRRRLLALKRYYESLLQVMEGLEENQNELFTQEQLHDFHLLTGRTQRLYNAVLNLRDYVTQVRESYQTQVDISLNEIMKVSTVITTIFFPLTLITGWYGMNLRMPEFSMRFAYPAVIAVSLLVVGGIVYYFRRKRWF